MNRKLALALFIIFVLILVAGLLIRSTALAPPTPGAIQGSWTDELLVIPEDGVRPVAGMIAGAGERVWLYVYMLSDRTIVNSLLDAVRRGVDVRVMLEKDPFGASSFNDAVRDELRKAGVQVQWSSPSFKLSHQKVLLVDRSRALVGTFNYVKTAFTTNREFGLVTDDPQVIKDLEALFQADWERKPFRPSSERLVVSPDNARPRILEHIRSSKKVLYMEQLSLQDAEVVAEILSAARRGVDVRIIMSPPQGKTDPDAGGRAMVKSAGGKVKLLEGLDVHAKVILADGSLLVGSQNLTAQSLDLNREVGLITQDSRAIERFVRTFERDWEKAK